MDEVFLCPQNNIHMTCVKDQNSSPTAKQIYYIDRPATPFHINRRNRAHIPTIC